MEEKRKKPRTNRFSNARGGEERGKEGAVRDSPQRQIETRNYVIKNIIGSENMLIYI